MKKYLLFFRTTLSCLLLYFPSILLGNIADPLHEEPTKTDGSPIAENSLCPEAYGDDLFYGTSNFTPIHDVYLQGSSRQNATIIRLENDYRIGYLMFDLNGINGNITAAELQITVNSDPGDGTIGIYKGSHNNWTETGITSSNKPAQGTLLGSVNGTHALGNTLTINLTPTQISSGKISFVVRHSAGNDVAIASKEHATTAIRPTLVITYEEDQTPPPPPPSNLYGSYELIDTNTGTPKMELLESNTITFSEAQDISVNAIPPNTTTQSVRFSHTGHARTESVAPYALYGDSSGDFTGRGRDLAIGNLQIQVQYYDAPSGGGSLLATDAISITVTEDDTTPPPPPPPPAPSPTSLVFVFDAAGNQKMRRPPSQSTALKVKLPVEEEFEPYGEAEAEEESFENSIAIYPNPTNGDLAMTWEATYDRLIRDITVMDMGNRTIHVGYNEGDREVRVDLTRYPAGVYLVHFSLTDGTTVIKKIIKQ